MSVARYGPHDVPQNPVGVPSPFPHHNHHPRHEERQQEEDDGVTYFRKQHLCPDDVDALSNLEDEPW